MMPDHKSIPFHRPSIGDDEIEEVLDTLRSGWLTTGPKTARLEQEFSSYVGAPFALAVNSCTAGLHLALVAMGIGRGDEVITTPLTFCATVNAIMHVGATPVLADIGLNGNIAPNSIESRITPRTRAIIPVHFAGLPCDLSRIWETARKHGLRVIEDAAHASGTIYRGSLIGSVNQEPSSGSDAVCFSFYATKNMTTAEGGITTTADPSLYDKMKLLCLHGISRDAWNRYSGSGSWFYQVHECGFKYNLSDLQAALGIHQLKKLEQFTMIRTRYATRYGELLRNVEEVELPRTAAQGDRHAWHLYSIRLNLERLCIDRAMFIEELRSRGIAASVHFIPIPMHPFFEPFAGLPQNQCPTALALYPRLVTLPLYPAMTEAEVDYVGTTVRKLLIKHSRRPTFFPTHIDLPIPSIGRLNPRRRIMPVQPRS